MLNRRFEFAAEMNRFECQEICDETGGDAAFDALVCRVVGQLEAGQPIDMEAIAAESPAYVERLQRLRPALEGMVALGCQKSLLSSEHSATGLQAGALAGVLGDFRIVREIGRGGMGVVYEAVQISLGRRIALKVLPFAGLLDRQQLARFNNEARAAATLDHPNIVAVHSVGSERGVNYYAMQYINGRSMAEVVVELRRATRTEASQPATPQNVSDVSKVLVAGEIASEPMIADIQVAGPPRPSLTERASATGSGVTKRELQAGISTWPATHSRDYFRNVAQLGVQAAEALDHAHAHGVLHRDVKPGNLLIDEAGKIWVTDFGLARIETDAGLTMTGDFLGTLRYMSPEQALAKREIIDHRSDIYSLGATFYELLTLEPAYAGNDRQDILRRIAFEEPRPPRQIDGRIPVDLETIISKAMEKDPAARYATAREMADDFRRFLASEPILAKPATLPQRLSKWSRRHVAVVWSAAAALLLSTIVLLAASLLVGKWYREAERQGEFAKLQLEEVIRQQVATRAAEGKEAATRGEIERNEYAREMTTTDGLLERGQIGSIDEMLQRYVPRPGGADLRGWEWYYYLARLHQERRTLYGHAGAITAVAWSPNGDYLASGGEDGRLNLWNPESGRLVRILAENENLFLALNWSPDSRRLVSGERYGKIRIWNSLTGEVIRTIQEENKGGVNDVGWSPDGAYIASCIYGDDIKIRNAESGKVLQAIPGMPGETPYFEWSPDGQRLAYRASKWERQTDAHGMEVKFWDIKEGRDGGAMIRHTRAYGWVTWSPDGKKLATDGSPLSLWDASSMQEVAKLEVRRPTNQQIAWSPSDQFLAVANEEVCIEIWDTETGQEINRFWSAPAGNQYRICWSPDGRFLAAGDRAGIVKIWRTDETDAALGVNAGTRYVAWSPDRSQVAAADGDGTIRLVSLADRDERVLPPYKKNPDIIVWSPDSNYVAIGGSAGYVSICDVYAGKELFQLPMEGSVSQLAWTRDGSTLAVVIDRADTLLIWDVFERRQIAQVVGNRRGAAATPLNDHLLAGGSECFDLVDPASGKSMLPFQIPAEASPRRVEAAAWSPDGTLIAAGGNAIAWLANPATGQPVRLLRGHQGRVRCAVWRPDGRQLATVSSTELMIWNVATGQTVCTIGGEFGTTPDVVWYPDGKTIVVFWGTGSHAIFDATKGYEYAGSADYDFNRAHRLAAAGEWDRAVSLFKQLADEHPENGQYAEAWQRHRIQAHLSKMEKYGSTGKWDQFSAESAALLEFAPGDSALRLQRAKILNNVAWSLATVLRDNPGESERAVELAKQACELTDYKAAYIVDTLAAAYAEAGDFEKAVDWQQRAIKLETDAESRKAWAKHLEAFQRHEPWREE